MANIIVRKYDHYNSSMGKHIRSREHYEKEMVAGGYIPYDKACQLAEKAKQENTKKYDGLKDSTMKFLHQVKDMSDSKGNIRVGSRFIEGLKEHGVNVDIPKEKIPSSLKGGFENG